jgi:ParB family transcriptional regulator, chromosome partitioning protein
VNALARHFQTARAAAAPTPAQRKAREWLPEAMLFPAVDADAPAEAEDEAESVEEGTVED